MLEKFVHGLSAALLCLVIATSASADIRVIVVSVDDVPYSLGPNSYMNSPSRYNNTFNRYDNSETRYSNSQTRYENSPSKYENGPSGTRRLISPSGAFFGYYVMSEDGVLNLYSESRRVAYMPADGDTQSVFQSNAEAWCGTLGELDGELILAMTRNCYLQFMLR